MEFLSCWVVLCWAVSALSGAEAVALSTKGRSNQSEVELEHRFAEAVDHMSAEASSKDGSDDEEQDDEEDQDEEDTEQDRDEVATPEAEDHIAAFQQESNKSEAQSASGPKEPDAGKRVVLLLRTLVQEMRAEGEKETQLLDAHLCWCKSEQHSLTVSVAIAGEKIPLLQNEMEETLSSLANFGESKKKYAGELEDGNSALRSAEGMRATEKARAEQLVDDLTANIDAIGKAVGALAAGRPADAQAFLQTPAATLLQKLARDQDFQAKVDDTDEGSRGSEAFLAYLGGSRTEGLDEVVGVCKQLKDSMEEDLASTKEKEQQAAASFEELKHTKEGGMGATTQLMEETNEQLSSLTTKKIRLQDDLDATKQSLGEDEMFLKQLTESCHAVTSDYHKRQEHRQDELESAMDAIKILSQDVSDLQTQHFASASSAPFFLQETAKASLSSTHSAKAKRSRHRRHHSHRKHRTSSASAVSTVGGSAASQQLILSLRGSRQGVKEPAVNFRLIGNLVDKTLLVIDAAQKKDDKDLAYCKKEIAEVETEQSDLRQKIDDLEAVKSEKNATLTGLIQQISELTSSIIEQDELVANLTAQRQREHADHVKAMVANHKAIELLELASMRLDKMYGAAPVKAKALLQGKSFRAPTLSAARPELKTSMDGVGSAAPQDGNRGTRVLTLIRNVKAGIQQECSAAKASEANAQAGYEKMVESAKKIRSTDAKHLVEREVSRTDAEVRLRALERDISSREERMSLLEKFLKDIHTKCDPMLANYDPHKAARKSEAEALNNARATLKIAPPPTKTSL